jgi:hypothetical protein
MSTLVLTTRRCERLSGRAPPSQTISSWDTDDLCAAVTSPSCSRHKNKNTLHMIWSRAKSSDLWPFPCCAYCLSTASPRPWMVKVYKFFFERIWKLENKQQSKIRVVWTFNSETRNACKQMKSKQINVRNKWVMVGKFESDVTVRKFECKFLTICTIL